MIKVRAADLSDVAQLTRWALAMAMETEGRKLSAQKLEVAIAAGINDENKARYFIAEVDGKIAGTLMLTREWSDWRNAWWWWIQSVYVPPESRRLGVYRALHEYVAKLGRSRGDVCGLRLYVERENAVAQETYQALGMHEPQYLIMEQSFES